MTESTMKMASHSIASAIVNAIDKSRTASFSRLFQLAFLLSALLTTSDAFSQTGAAISGQFVTPTGTPAYNAQITICPYTSTGIPCYPQATVYSDPALTTPLTQPIATNQYGNLGGVWAPAGSYLEQVKVNQTLVYSYYVTVGSGGGGGNCSPSGGGSRSVWWNGTACVAEITDYNITQPLFVSTEVPLDTSGINGWEVDVASSPSYGEQIVLNPAAIGEQGSGAGGQTWIFGSDEDYSIVLSSHGETQISSSSLYICGDDSSPLAVGTVCGGATAQMEVNGNVDVDNNLDVTNGIENIGYLQIPQNENSSSFSLNFDSFSQAVDAGAGPITVTLPIISTGSSSNYGESYLIFKEDASMNAVTIVPDVTQSIDGQSSYVLSSQYDYVVVTAVLTGLGRYWQVLSSSAASSGGDTITSPGSTLTVGGTSTNTTLDLNLGHANTWTAAQTFNLGLTIASGNSLTNTGVADGCGTWASGVLGSTGSACGSGGGGGVSGSGTTGYLPIWTGSTALGNSLLDYGVTHAGKLNVPVPSYFPITYTGLPEIHAIETWQQLAPVGTPWAGTSGFGSAALYNWMSFDGDNATGTLDPVGGYAVLESIGDTQTVDQPYAWYNELDLDGNAPVNYGYAETNYAANYGNATVSGWLVAADDESENDAGSVNQLIGVNAGIHQWLGGTTTLGTPLSVGADINGAGSSYTTLHMIDISSPVRLGGTGTIGTNVGLFINEMGVAFATTPYQIYSAGTAKSYFHGSMQFDNLPTTAQTSVVGIDSSGNLYKNAAGIPGGALGSIPYQSAANTTTFVAGATTSGHTFVLAEQPSGSLIAPTLLDLGTYLGANITGTSPIVATPSTLGAALSCPTCDTSGSLTSNTLPKATGAHALSDSLFTDNGTNGAYGGTGTFTVPSLTTGSGSSACGTATGCIAMVEASTAGTPTSGSEYIRANSSNHQLVYSFNGVAESNLVTPLYGTTGTLQASPHIVNGGGSLSGGTLTVTLTGAAVFSASSSYVCSPDDSTAVNGIQVTYTSGSSFTLTGTGTDAVRYTCVGN